MTSEPTVFIVDDDAGARESVSALVESMELRSRCYASAEAFLVDYDGTSPGCVVTDLRMSGMSGLELQQELDRHGMRLPVILISAHANVAVAVRSMQAGAVTVLTKSCSEHDLWDSIRKALDFDSKRRRDESRRAVKLAQLHSLTPDEKVVLDGLVAGKLNKMIARELGVSLRTVESRRHSIMQKLHVDSLAELVRLIAEMEQYLGGQS